MRQKGWITGSTNHPQGVVDIGTSKVTCLIATVENTDADAPADSGRPSVHVLGVGHHRASGLKAGVITDIDQAEHAVRAAIAQAEAMAGLVLQEVRLSVSCGRLKSHRFTASAETTDGVITDADFARVIDAGQAFAERDRGVLLSLNPVSVRLDGIAGAVDPRGLAAREVTADLHAVTADEPPLRNLMLTVERCYVEAHGLSPAAFASGLAVTTAAERTLGTTTIDLGAGTSTIAMFADGRFIHTDAIAMAGNQITLDIARALHAPLAEAERIKALYGTVVSAPSDEHDVITLSANDNDDEPPRQVSKAEIANIIRPRMRAILGELRERMDRCDVGRYAGGRVVLTGGTSQLAGLADFAANELGRPVRVARQPTVDNVPPNVTSPAFSTSLGLLLADLPEFEGLIGFRSENTEAQGYMERVGAWLRESF